MLDNLVLFTMTTNKRNSNFDKKEFPYYHWKFEIIKKGDIIRVVLNSKAYYLKALRDGRAIDHPVRKEFLRKQGYYSRFKLIEISSAKDYKRQVPGKLKKEVIAEAKNKCAICDDYTKKGNVDHIKPFERNGKTIINNLQYLCEKCHQLKTKRDSADSLLELRRQKSKIRPRPHT